MDKLICQKCRGEILNEFGVTLTYCTNCGASIKNLQAEKTVALNEVPTLVSPKPVNFNSPPNSKTTRNVLGCLGIGFGLVLLSMVGIAAYWYWSVKAEYHPDYFGKIVPPTSQIVRVVDFESDSLDPHLRNEAIIVNALFDGLAEFNNQNAELSPSLATSWEKNADATIWTFRLRKDAKWSDGAPVTANDFVYSWRRILHPDFKAATLAYNLISIKNADLYNTRKATAEDLGVRAIDDYTLQVTMEKPTPFFNKMIAQTVFRPVPQQAIEKFGENWTKPENIVTSGAFKLTELTPKNQTVIERNPQFWDNAKTKLEKIVFISHEKTSLLSSEPIDTVDFYEKGEMDVTFLLNSPNKNFKEKKEKVKDFIRTKINGANFLYINTTIKPFSDVRVRNALSLAIDREQLKKQDLAVYPTYSFTPDFKGYENAKGGTFNPTEARKLLAEAGFSNGNNFPELEIIFNNTNLNKVIVEFVQEQWQRELGIKVNLKAQEFKDWLKASKDLTYRGVAVGGWVGDYADPHSFFSLFEEEKNYAGWNDTRFREMLTKANIETDEAKRYQLLNEAEKYLIAQQPVIPLTNQVYNMLCKPYIKNLAPNSLKQINWREVYVDENVTVGKL